MSSNNGERQIPLEDESADITEIADIDSLERMVKEKGVGFPKGWAQFNDREKRRACHFLFSGGFTPLGFEELKPGWMDGLRKEMEKTERRIKNNERILKPGKHDLD